MQPADVGAAPHGSRSCHVEPSVAEPAFDEPAFDDDFDNARRQFARRRVAARRRSADGRRACRCRSSRACCSTTMRRSRPNGAAAAEVAAPVVDAPFDDDFDNAVSMSLEDELTLDEPCAMRQTSHAGLAAVEVAESSTPCDHAVADEDFAGHFDDAMADVDMDFAAQVSTTARLSKLGLDVEVRAEPCRIAVDRGRAALTIACAGGGETPAWTRASPSRRRPQEAFDDFDLNFDDALAEKSKSRLPRSLPLRSSRAMAPPVRSQPAAPSRLAQTNGHWKTN